MNLFCREQDNTDIVMLLLVCFMLILLNLHAVACATFMQGEFYKLKLSQCVQYRNNLLDLNLTLWQLQHNFQDFFHLLMTFDSYKK